MIEVHRKFSLDLKYALFLCFTLVSTIPVLLLGYWIQQSALDMEFEAVAEKHLLHAKNVTAALSRYAGDATAVFQFTALQAEQGFRKPGLIELLAQHHFRQVLYTSWPERKQSFDPDRHLTTAKAFAERGGLTAALVEALDPYVAEARKTQGEITYSDVVAGVSGKPSIFLIQAKSPERIVLGELSTRYMVDLEESIKFGERGHAAIVDRRGRIISHPNQSWREEMRDISAVKPVGKMMEAKTGVTEFFSPAVKQDMIAGYTIVPGVGWGVMVPQPLSELHDRAKDVRVKTLAIMIIGIVIAGCISWLLARHLARPIDSIARSAQEISDGWLDSRASGPVRLVPSELVGLSNNFNVMADRIGLQHRKLMEAQATLEEKVGQRTQELEEANAKLRQLDKVRRQFFAEISHELRTPVTIIRGESQVALRHGGELAENYQTVLRRIVDLTGQMGRMVDDLLFLAQTDAQALSYRFELLAIDVTVHDVCNELAAFASERGVRMTFDDQTIELEEGEKQVLADKHRIKQMIYIILENALRYSLPQGEVLIEMRVLGGGFEVRISDRGIGIESEDLEKVFNRFFRGLNARRYAAQGTGLGLAVAKSIIDAHGGLCRIDSRKDEGTSVCVWLPQASPGAAVSEAGLPATEDEPNPDAERRRDVAES